MDLLNNSGLALIRQAEQEPAGGVPHKPALRDWGERCSRVHRSLGIAVSSPPAFTPPPAVAPECLANASEACSTALELDPGNSKARYRRALARYRQGKLRAAQQDLASIPGER